MKKVLATLTLLTLSLGVNSANVDTSYFKIDKVRISDLTGNAYIDPVGTAEIVNDSCTQKNLYSFYKDDPLFNQIYSTALAAAASGKQVKVWVSDEPGDCLSGYQKVRVIEVNF